MGGGRGGGVGGEGGCKKYGTIVSPASITIRIICGVSKIGP